MNPFARWFSPGVPVPKCPTNLFTKLDYLQAARIILENARPIIDEALADFVQKNKPKFQPDDKVLLNALHRQMKDYFDRPGFPFTILEAVADRELIHEQLTYKAFHDTYRYDQVQDEADLRVAMRRYLRENPPKIEWVYRTTHPTIKWAIPENLLFKDGSPEAQLYLKRCGLLKQQEDIRAQLIQLDQQLAALPNE